MDAGVVSMTRRRVIAVLAVLVAAVVLVGTGCKAQPKPEDVIRDSITKELDGLKTGRDLSFVEALQGDVKSDFDQMGVKPEDFAKAYLSGFDYQIGEITVDEDKGTATAQVAITIKSMNDVMTAFNKEYAKQAAALKQWPTDSQLMELGGKIVLKAAKDATPKKTDVTLSYTRDKDGAWKADGGGLTTELATALLN